MISHAPDSSWTSRSTTTTRSSSDPARNPRCVLSRRTSEPGGHGGHRGRRTHLPVPRLRGPDHPREVVDRGRARSLTHAARMLRDYAHELEHMRASGLELASPVMADYGIVRPGGAPSDDDLDG